MKYGNLQTSHKQQGAALMVGLILLLVMTVLGVSGMGMARLEILMAGNMQFGQLAFQAAESGIEGQIGAAGFSTTLNNNRPMTFSYLGGASTATTNIRYVTTGTVPAGGFSIGSSVAAYHFEITSSGAATRGARSDHRQGFYIVGPGGT
ncbi:MAG: pilus assembly PilX N-terminal domain-containing protein [Gammaproteobacteria bacterium]|nr:pilus assembly PilX N-terminal domain-containing protein [Gammaproteobacteria bacterium]